MTAHESIPEAEVDRLRELSHIGASWAATAFSQIAGRTILTRVPEVHGPERYRRRSEWSTGIFFEVKGAIDGAIAVFLTPSKRDVVVGLMLGEEQPPLEKAASALCEFGNILASHAVSAIADTLGERILLGLPDLVLENAEPMLEGWLAPGYREVPPLFVESELFDRQGEFRALHVLLPEVRVPSKGR